MKSIRTKLFLNINFLVIFFVLVSWGFSALYLKDFYLWHKKNDIVDSSQTIATSYDSGSHDISLELERIANNFGASILITDQNGYLKYSSFSFMDKRSKDERPIRIPQFDSQQDFAAHHAPPDPNMPPPPPPPIVLSRETAGNSVIEMKHNQELNVNFMTLTRTLHNKDVLIIQLPLAAVSESASYASKFMAFTGILSILAGCLWAFVFAKKFTIPLLELSSVAQSISRLDFSRKCSIRSEDEVGKLGESLNNLSEQLNRAISELNQTNQRLIEDVEKERSLDKLRRNFISSVSHELRTPISLILGYAEGLKENVAQDITNKEYYCSVIIDEAEKMTKLVKDLLNLSQIESGYFHLERTDFDISLLLDDILHKYQTALTERNITLEIHKSSSAIVNGDVLRIEQIIVNLLNNAIDHAEIPNIIRINITNANNKLRVGVYNTGKPIPADSLKNVWLSFYKVDTARTRSMGGYGLGLSIVRAIQELHGNSYGVENVDLGVLFWFDIDQPA